VGKPEPKASAALFISYSHEDEAIAGATYPYVDPNRGTPAAFHPDAAVPDVSQGIPTPPTGPEDRYLPAFPYVGSPYDGYDTPSS